MKVYAYKKNSVTGINTISISLNKKEFTNLQILYNNCTLIGNYESMVRGYKKPMDSNVPSLVFKSLCKLLDNNDNIKHFKDESTKVTFVILKTNISDIKKYEKHLMNIFKLFENNVNVNNITYTDNECSIMVRV